MNVPVYSKEDEENLDAVYMMLDPDGSADHSFSEFVSILGEESSYSVQRMLAFHSIVAVAVVYRICRSRTQSLTNDYNAYTCS